MRKDPVTVAAAVVVAVEGIALAATAVWMIAALVTGGAGDGPSALALILMTAAGSAALVAFAVAILGRHGWARSGAIVAQLLILAVALGAATGAYGSLATAVVLAAPAILALALVIAAARAAARPRSGDEAQE
ncbi:histidine kinase [Microbacterium sp. NPDC078428]|uniref:histidine kinase n=1 Tax=Microbacterium sp. NPDC078428 TaxID=3364190 RepID=UPI0037CC48C8